MQRHPQVLLQTLSKLVADSAKACHLSLPKLVADADTSCSVSLTKPVIDAGQHRYDCYSNMPSFIVEKLYMQYSLETPILQRDGIPQLAPQCILQISAQ